jgi:predicted negative regulator of RcsB-dependent stress response
MLPFFEKGTISTANYNQEYYKLLQDISKSDSSNIHDRRHELAKFLFLHEMYNEAAAILSLINEEAPRFMLQRPEVKFLYSVSFTLSGRYDEAEKNYRSLLRNIQNGRNIDEIKIWLNLNNFYQYNTNQYVGLENFEDRFIFTYPDNLYFKIALTDLEVALKNNNNDLADKIFNGLREFKREDIRLLNNIKYLRAKYFINKQEYEKAKQYLNALKLDNRDPYNQVKAQIELAKTQLNLKEIDTVKAITILNSIKQNWRGDFVEYDLLMLLAKLYRENSQPINALRTYKYIIESSPLKTDQLFITAEMISLFNKIFSPGGAAETMSNFDTVSLFYEFKELTPIGSAGDNVVIQIANRLVNLDLLETAETLLKHQVTYRLIGEKRVDVGDKLAYIYLINKKPDLAIKVLDETDKDNFAYNEHLKRIRLKAKAYLDMQNFKYALQLIKDDNSVAADLLREEIYFKTQNWEKYISLVEPDVLNKINKGEEFFNTDKQTLIQLLISYLMVSDKMKLNLLKDRLKTSNIEIKNLIEFFGNQTKSINYKDLEESLNLKNIDNFLESIKKDMFDNGKNIGKDK